MAVWVASVMRSTMGLGVAAGTNRPRNSRPIMPGTPCSMAVGISGAAVEPLRRVHRQDADLAGAMQLQHLPGDVRRHHRDMPADEVGDAGPRALVGNVNEIAEPGELLEQLARKIAHGAGAGGAVGELAGIGLGVGDQLVERSSPAPTRAPTIDVVETRDDRDRHEVLGGIVRHLGHGHRIEHHGAGAAEQDRVAVGLRARDLAGRDRAGAAALVLHDRPCRAASSPARPTGARPRRSRRRPRTRPSA